MKKIESKTTDSKFVYALTEQNKILCKSVADALQRASFDTNISQIKFVRNNKTCYYIRTGPNSWKESSL